jgi:uncharacterized HhH-GPD family protein
MHLAQDPPADALLDADPFALLVGMLLDQQQPMERAFAGPSRMCQRLGWQRLDPVAVTALGQDRLTEVMRTSPAVHRYPGAMAKRVAALADVVARDYEGDCTAIWSSGDAAGVLARLQALPGFGERKAKIFLALLGKQRAVTPLGWRDACAPFGAPGAALSAADVTDATSLAAVRAAKRDAKTRST